MNEVNLEMLKMARDSRGMNQADLAKKTGISQALISFFESGQRDISHENLQLIANALNYPTDFFFLEGNYIEPISFPEYYHQKYSNDCTPQKKRSKK